MPADEAAPAGPASVTHYSSQGCLLPMDRQMQADVSVGPRHAPAVSVIGDAHEKIHVATDNAFQLMQLSRPVTAVDNCY